MKSLEESLEETKEWLRKQPPGAVTGMAVAVGALVGHSSHLAASMMPAIRAEEDRAYERAGIQRRSPSSTPALATVRYATQLVAASEIPVPTDEPRRGGKAARKMQRNKHRSQP